MLFAGTQDHFPFIQYYSLSCSWKALSWCLRETKTNTVSAFILVLSWRTTKSENPEFQNQNEKATLMDKEGKNLFLVTAKQLLKCLVCHKGETHGSVRNSSADTSYRDEIAGDTQNPIYSFGLWSRSQEQLALRTGSNSRLLSGWLTGQSNNGY